MQQRYAVRSSSSFRFILVTTMISGVSAPIALLNKATGRVLLPVWLSDPPCIQKCFRMRHLRQTGFLGNLAKFVGTFDERQL
jgi:hypothetical protein